MLPAAPIAPTVPTCNKPPSMATPLVNVLLADNVSVPAPALPNDTVPARNAEAKVTSLPLVSKIARVPELTLRRVDMSVVLPKPNRSVLDPAKVMLPEVPSPPVANSKVPAEIRVPPV